MFLSPGLRNSLQNKSITPSIPYLFEPNHYQVQNTSTFKEIHTRKLKDLEKASVFLKKTVFHFIFLKHLNFNNKYYSISSRG